MDITLPRLRLKSVRNAVFLSALIAIGQLRAQDSTQVQGLSRPDSVVSLTTTSDTIGLEEAIGIALKSNPQLRQAALQVDINLNNLRQSKWQRWPSLSFNTGLGFNFGRTIDPFTNQYIQQNVNSTDYSFNGGLTIFNGLRVENTIKQNGLNAEASQKDLERARNDLMINVATAYLQILSNRELVQMSENQVRASQTQVDRTQKLVNAGSMPLRNLLDLKAQLANDELSLVNAQNGLDIAKVTLKQTLNLEGSEVLDVKKIDVGNPAVAVYDAPVQEVYESALSRLPEVQAARLRTESADRGIRIARSQYLPTLSLNGGIGSRYSSAASGRFVPDGKEPSLITEPLSDENPFVNINGQRLPVLVERFNVSGTQQPFGFWDQLNFSRSSFLGLSLNIPIFNNFQAKYQVANAKIQHLNTKYQNEVVNNQLRQTVEQAYLDMVASAKSYSATLNQVRAQEEAFRVAESQYNAGALNAADYNIAKANLDRARANLIQTKYNYVFRTKIIDFYMGKPLETN